MPFDRHPFDWASRSKKVSNVSSYEQSIGFVSAGSRYICVCGIVTEFGDNIAIDNNNINRFEWANEVNHLCLEGFAEIVDTTGKIGSIFSQYFCHLVFEIKRLKDNPEKKDGDGKFEDTSESEAVFRHTFIINNIEIMRRTKQFVVYRLYLVGTEWYGLVQNHAFSNYDAKLVGPTDTTTTTSTNSISELIPEGFGQTQQNKSSNSLIDKLTKKITGKITSLSASISNTISEKTGGIVQVSATGASINTTALASAVSSKIGGKLGEKLEGNLGGLPQVNGSGTTKTPETTTVEQSPTEIFSIIKRLLSNAFENRNVYEGEAKPTINSESFEKAANKNISLHVCFGHNSSIFESIRYLLNKLYYNVFNGGNLVHDDALKMIVYDEFQNQYGIIKYGEDSNFITTTRKDAKYLGTWMSLFGSSFEALTDPIEQDLGSVVKKSTTDLLLSFFRKVYCYFTANGIRSIPIEPGEIAAYSYNEESFPKVVGKKFKPRISKDLMSKYFEDYQGNYSKYGSEWNNDFSIYHDQVTNLINKDVLILYTKGDITHVPGIKYGIQSDSCIASDLTTNSKDNQKNKQDNKEITGYFNVIKVRHVVKPNSKEKDNFTEKLFLSRNFEEELKMSENG